MVEERRDFEYGGVEDRGLAHDLLLEEQRAARLARELPTLFERLQLVEVLESIGPYKLETHALRHGHKELVKS